MCEEKEGVMRNAMTTRAPGGAKNTIEHHGNRLYGFMGLQSKMSEWVSGFEEKEGVMRNAMTTRAPCGANNRVMVKVWIIASIIWRAPVSFASLS